MLKQKMCIGCQVVLTAQSEYGYMVSGLRKFAKFCPPCAKEKWLEWKRTTDKRLYTKYTTSEEWVGQKRTQLRRNSIKRKFGIDEHTYARMFAAQSGVCASCNNPETIIDPRSGLPKALAVDHNHATGEVRALLCAACNIAFGLMNESPDRIKLLLQYAEKQNT